MKTPLKIFIFIFVLVFINIQSAHATVGGPTYINDLKYNHNDESVYYKLYDLGGRGCPPILMKISLVNGKTDTVYSCDKGEDFLNNYQSDYILGISKLNEEFNKITTDFKHLTSINIRKNNINVNLKFLRSENLEGELDMMKNSVFKAEIFKDNNKIIDTEISGCNIDQPFTFMAYSIPGFDKKILILNSSKGDCMEGGYTNESLIVLGGLDNINKEPVNYYKGDSALVPNEGSITVYAGNNEDNIESNHNLSNIDSNKNISNTIDKYSNYSEKYLYFGFLFIIAFSVFLGFMISKMTKK